MVYSQNACLSNFRHAQAEVCDVFGGMEQHHITSRIVANFAQEMGYPSQSMQGLTVSFHEVKVQWPNSC